MLKKILLFVALSFSSRSFAEEPSRLYLVGYSHLDTQWLWTYEDSIHSYLKNTLDQNFQLFEKYPDYQFNFTGAFRYQLMKEYWPERYARLKGYIASGRWHVAGSSWEENDVLIPDPESVLRQILYGNLFFKEEFGKTSVDYMLPDSFGFPASLPTLISHAGLKGFSSQKLSWGAARGIPFNIGIWSGPDGSRVLSALNPGPYDSFVPKSFQQSEEWSERLRKNPEIDGKHVDFRYFGIGDSGGAPRSEDVDHLMEGLHDPNKKFELVAGSSDQIFRDFADRDLKGLPEASGEFLLVEHSAGTLTSNSTLKVANRRSEHKAIQAETLASIAAWRGTPYPKAKIRKGWEKLLAAEMHDIMGGTAIPKANSHSHNDHAIAQNIFDSVMESSAAALAAQMDSSGPGLPILISNTGGTAREDLVEIKLAPELGPFTHALAPDGSAIPLQVGPNNSYLFPVSLAPMETAIYSLIKRDGGDSPELPALAIDDQSIESDRLKVTIGKSGDIVSLWNKTEQREELSAPVRYEFLNEFPTKYPAWNMTWKDRKRPPRSYLAGEASVTMLEKGPYRSSLKIERKGEGSRFTQVVSLVRGRPVVTIEDSIDWFTRDSSLKVAISPNFSSKTTSYDMGLSVEDRLRNSEKLFEMPQHQWMAMASQKGDRGLSVINACCYGSDKPGNGTMRLTLLYTPHSRLKEYDYNASQDFGRHVLRWGIYPHPGNWQSAQTQAVAEQMNTELLRYQILDSHPGPLGKRFSFLRIKGATLKALKQEENGSKVILRLAERNGTAGKFSVEFPSPLKTLGSVDAQEQNFQPLSSQGQGFEGSLERFGLKSYALELESPAPSPALTSQSVKIDFNGKAFSNRDRSLAASGPFAARSLPIEEYPRSIVDRGISFELGKLSPTASNILQAKGQQIKLPAKGRTLHILAFGSRDKPVTIKIDGQPHTLVLARWNGPIADADRRVLDKDFKMLELWRGFRKSPSIAAFAGYTHGLKGNLTYVPNYLFHYSVPSGKLLELPDDPDFYIAAIATADDRPLLSLMKGVSP